MEALLAMGLLSAGSNVVNKVVDACSGGPAAASSASSTTSFDNVLKSEVTNSASKYSAMDADSLATEKASLQKKLCANEDVKEFVGNDKSFKISQSGDGCQIERADGKVWHIPADSDAGALAKDYCDCSTAQARQGGNPISGLRSTWTVEAAA